MSQINWVEIMEDNREKIIEAFIQAKKETNNTMQGWHVDVEINEKGEVWVGGLMSTGSQSMSSWNGETYIIGSVNSWVSELNEEAWIQDEKEIYAEFLAQKDEEDGYESAWEFMENKYPEIRQEWQDNENQYEIDAFAEEADSIIDRRIEDEKEYQKYSVNE